MTKLDIELLLVPVKTLRVILNFPAILLLSDKCSKQKEVYLLSRYNDHKNCKSKIWVILTRELMTRELIIVEGQTFLSTSVLYTQNYIYRIGLLRL